MLLRHQRCLRCSKKKCSAAPFEQSMPDILQRDRICILAASAHFSLCFWSPVTKTTVVAHQLFRVQLVNILFNGLLQMGCR